MKIVLEPLVQEVVNIIGIRFKYNFQLKEYLKKFEGVRWDKMHRCFCILYDPALLDELIRYLEKENYRVDSTAFHSSKKKSITHSKNRNIKLPDISPENRKVYEEFLRYLKGKRYSKSTISVYGGFVFEFLQFTGEKPVETLTENDVRLYTEWAVNTLNYAISTHRQLIGAIKQFSYFFPACSIDTESIYQPRKDKKLPTVLNKDEIVAVLQHTRNLKHRTVIALLYSSGLRIGELIDLELSCFDLDRRQLHVRSGKGRKDRVVILAESFLPLFRNYYFTYRPKVFFIENPKGGKYSPGSIRSFLKQSCKLAGIVKPVTPHTLRHSYATHLLENGTDIRYIQVLLGHTRPETTMIYTHVAQKDLQGIQSPLDTTLLEMSSRDKDNRIPLLTEDIYGIKTIK